MYTVSNSQQISTQAIFCKAFALSQQLPDGKFAINLCNNRLLFTITFLAVALKKQINILPPNKAIAFLNKVHNNHDQSYFISDNKEGVDIPCFIVDQNLIEPTCGAPNINLDAEQIVTLSYTSGSTGIPKQITKTWGEFNQAACLALRKLRLQDRKVMLVSTVPPQHMYGLETSVFWPLNSSLTISHRRPFYPADIENTCTNATTPCVLISTPHHLKACVESGLTWSNLAKIISSTAPLDKALAIDIETTFKAELFEMFGSTETLSFATRRPVLNSRWSTYEGIKMNQSPHPCTIKGGHLKQEMKLEDHLEIHDNQSFSMSGRSSEIIKVVGKRITLAELNKCLNAIEGILDGIFYQPTKEKRVCALVVSKLPKNSIMQALKQYIDPVFLPRPLYFVEKIPRNQMGKIVKSTVDQLLTSLDQPKKISKSCSIPGSHPALAGHFPGSPIVPGVVILNQVKDLLDEWRPNMQFNSLPQVKFHTPLKADQTFFITLAETTINQIKFECSLEQEKLTSGFFSIDTIT